MMDLPHDPGREADQQAGARLAALVERAILLDSRFRIPLINVRVGWDPIISAIPFVGDITMALVAAGLVREAARLGIGRAILARMVANVLIDMLLGMVPIAGPVLDILFRANVRNAALVTDELARRRLTT